MPPLPEHEHSAQLLYVGLVAEAAEAVGRGGTHRTVVCLHASVLPVSVPAASPGCTHAVPVHDVHFEVEGEGLTMAGCARVCVCCKGHAHLNT